MGLTKVTVKLTGLQPKDGAYEAVFLVDTGATDASLRRDGLEKIGVAKEGKTSYELADGTVKEYAYGLVRIEFLGEITAGRVIFWRRGGRADSRSHRPGVGRHCGGSSSRTLRRLPAIPLK